MQSSRVWHTLCSFYTGRTGTYACNKSSGGTVTSVDSRMRYGSRGFERALRAALIALFVALLASGPAVVHGQSDETALWQTSAHRRLALTQFAILNDRGEFVTRTEAATADLARLTRIVPAAIGARLVQSAEYDVLELDERYRPFPAEPPADAAAVPSPVVEWLRAGIADEVITGTVGTLQTSLVVTAQRYGMRDGEPALLGAAAATAARVDEAVKLADTLIENLFPVEADIVTRSIEQLFIVPSTMRLPIGRQAQLQAYAIDALGRPLSKVDFIFQSSDSAYLEVDQDGVIRGVAPGQATVTIRAVGRPARTSTATATVNVVPPTFGLRAGTVVSGRDVDFGQVYRLGLRITPTVDMRPRTTQQGQVTRDLETAASNPLSFLTNVFSSLLSDGLFTIELEIEPNEAMLFTLDAIQRTSGGFFGTGIGFASPLRTGGPQGVTLRLTAGTQVDLFGRTSLPFELNTDIIFPTGDAAGTGSHVRVAITTGFDLFQH